MPGLAAELSDAMKQDTPIKSNSPVAKSKKSALYIKKNEKLGLKQLKRGAAKRN
jgi:hypothetical protein